VLSSIRIDREPWEVIMEDKLSMLEKIKITKKYANQYHKLPKEKKSQVLDHLCKTNDWTRKHAIRRIDEVRKGEIPKRAKSKGEKVKRTPKYGDDLVPIVTRIWHLSGLQNSKSLHALINMLYHKYKQFGEFKDLNITHRQEELILEMSESTLSRMLKPARKKNELKGKSTTKAGLLLRNSIKLRRAGDEQEDTPGFVEVDTVAHCGASLKGEFARTITMTDVCTSWTENAAIRNNAHSNIEKGLDQAEDGFPFPLTGFDCDNGAEFINKYVVKWVSQRDLYFTRSRPYKKNDNAHVEQKNNDIVRRLAFYYRYDTATELKLLNELYRLSSLFYNYFRAVTKAIGYRETKPGHRVRTYDAPKTPFQRVCDSGVLSEEKKKEMVEKLEKVNPAQVLRDIVTIQNKLIELAKARECDEPEYLEIVRNLIGEAA
jgi:hypothetical protein